MNFFIYNSDKTSLWKWLHTGVHYIYSDNMLNSEHNIKNTEQVKKKWLHKHTKHSKYHVSCFRKWVIIVKGEEGIGDKLFIDELDDPFSVFFRNQSILNQTRGKIKRIVTWSTKGLTSM